MPLSIGRLLLPAVLAASAIWVAAISAYADGFPAPYVQRIISCDYRSLCYQADKPQGGLVADHWHTFWDNSSGERSEQVEDSGDAQYRGAVSNLKGGITYTVHVP